jgi:hypothetical protein
MGVVIFEVLSTYRLPLYASGRRKKGGLLRTAVFVKIAEHYEGECGAVFGLALGHCADEQFKSVRLF